MATQVTLYVKRDCPHCNRQREAIVARGLAFTEIDVSVTPEAIPELLKLTGGRRIVPVLVEGARINVAHDGGSHF